MAIRSILICMTLSLSIGIAYAQTPYDALIQQGKNQLQAGNSAAALSTSQQGIQFDANRWEAYALAGGALMNLKRYEEAEDQFSHAIDHAPEAKQAGLRDLRKQCVLAEAGVAAQPAVAAPPQPANTSQAEIVLWKTIENSSNIADFESYLQQYPNGAFAVLAQRHVADAKAQSEQEQETLKAQADLKAEQLQARTAAKYSVNHYVVGFGSNFRPGLILFVPNGIEYQTTKEHGFQASCSDVRDLGLSAHYVQNPLEFTVSGKKYVFYPNVNAAGSTSASSSYLMALVAEHCGIAAK
jgi:hypothetical protein